jgi:hypothetical protein
MKKKKKSEEDSENIKPLYCTECGEDLELAGISKVDIKVIEERHKNCKLSGKFNGEKCAMLYIVKDDPEFNLKDEEE